MLEDAMALTGIRIRLVEDRDRAACLTILLQHHLNTTFRDRRFRMTSSPINLRGFWRARRRWSASWPSGTTP